MFSGCALMFKNIKFVLNTLLQNSWQLSSTLAQNLTTLEYKRANLSLMHKIGVLVHYGLPPST